MKRVYIAGALNSDAVGYVKNMHKMIEKADQVRKAGYSVFVPCLDILLGLYAGDYEYSDYAGNNMAWLEASDAVLVLPNSEKSRGTQAELKRALELDIPIVESIKELEEQGILPE